LKQTWLFLLTVQHGETQPAWIGPTRQSQLPAPQQLGHDEQAQRQDSQQRRRHH
jgi:hypothetical protein